MQSTSRGPVRFKNLELFIHVSFWAWFIAERWFNQHHNPVHQTITIIFSAIPLYINILFLFPNYFKKRKWFTFLLYLVSIILLSNFLRALFIMLYLWLSSTPFNFQAEFTKWAFYEYGSYDQFIFSPNTWVIYLSFAYLLIKDWIINERVKSKLESEKLSMELAFLKAQVNPHFLFNTLNNLYALSLEEKAQRTSDAITKMGALMRYNLHDAQAERILLTKELDYLDQYIELQKLRIVKQSQISFYTNVQPGNCTAKVAPMILLPFIENAFKYGVSTVGETRIQAEAVLVQDTFKLTVKNTLHKNPERVESGIGLKNVRNRLELIYGGKYALKQTKDDEEYSIELELDLTE
jgi:two-component system LytT family sensor kinase